MAIKLRFDFYLPDYNLLRISYTKIKNIDQILTNFLSKETNSDNA